MELHPPVPNEKFTLVRYAEKRAAAPDIAGKNAKVWTIRRNETIRINGGRCLPRTVGAETLHSAGFGLAYFLVALVVPDWDREKRKRALFCLRLVDFS